MSRIGKQPVSIPDKVKVTVTGEKVLVEGPKGKVEKTFAPVVKVTVADKKVTFAPTEETRFAKAMYGTARSIVAGMVKGVTEGYAKDLEIQGVGFKANLKGNQLDLARGYSHPILMEIPAGIKVTV
jgi:large subunit ribosomal protein L6